MTLFVRLRKLLAAPWSSWPRAAVSVAVLLGLAAGAAYGGRALWLEHHLRAAEQAEERRDFDGARDHLATYLAAYPDSGPAHLLAARNARRAGHDDEAAEHLDACRRVRYGGEDVDLERLLLKVQRGEPVDGNYLREKVERGDHNTPYILEVLADAYVRGGRYYDALWCLDRYLERRPDEVTALLGRALVWENINQFAEAERDYRRALEINPDNDKARLRFADLLLAHRGTADEAAAEYEHLYRRDPDHPAYRLGLARCRRQAGRLDEARQLLADLVRRDPPYPGALTEMGRVAEDDGKPAEAIDWLRRAITAAPADKVAYGTLLNCLRLAGRTDEERDCRARLERLDADLKRIGELRRALSERPPDADLCSELGVLLLRTGQEEDGKRLLGVALELKPAHPGAHRALAEYYEAHGQPEQAAPHRRFAPKGP